MGRVYSGKRGQLMKPLRETYHRITLTVKNESIQVSLHRLVYASFHKMKIPPNHDIDHINKNIDDNRLENLQMLTRREHLIKDLGKPVKCTFSDGRSYVYASVSLAAEAIGTLRETLSNTIAHHQFHQGYKWEFASKEEISTGPAPILDIGYRAVPDSAEIYAVAVELNELLRGKTITGVKLYPGSKFYPDGFEGIRNIQYPAKITQVNYTGSISSST